VLGKLDAFGISGNALREVKNTVERLTRTATSLTAKRLILIITRWTLLATQVFSSVELIRGIMIDAKIRSFQEK